MSKACFANFNWFDYDPILPPPARLPAGIITVYATDTDRGVSRAIELGWNQVYRLERPFEKKDVGNMLKLYNHVAHAYCYPERVVPELTEFDRVFLTDSNIVVLDSGYGDFVEKCTEQYALFLTSGDYRGARDNILAELHESKQKRWLFNYAAMEEATLKYVDAMKAAGGFETSRVVSAKYKGWNLRHKMKDVIADYVFGEYKKHIQGNIILTMAGFLFREHILNHQGFRHDGRLAAHQAWQA